MVISNKIKGLIEQGSWIRRMFEDGIALKEQYGADNVFDLSLGNPIMEPPQEFFDVLRRIAENPTPGMHRYMPNAGYQTTRDQVASHLSDEIGINFAGHNVLMTCGAGGALNVVLKALLDDGDEVVIFSPYFVEYHFYADNHGGKCRVVRSDENFLPDIDDLDTAINENTRAVLINSPNNPTGMLYSAKLLNTMCEVIQSKELRYGRDIFLISDEPYRKILFDGLEYPHVFYHHKRSIVATSHSKDLALPGERIGYIAIHPECDSSGGLMEALTFCNRVLGFVNAPALMQHIVSELGSAIINVAEYQDKRDFLYENLVSIGYKVKKPDGAFYMFPEAPIENDETFVAELRDHRVLVVPGKGFGSPGHFRISYCVDDITLEGSLTGFKAALDRFH